MATMHVTRSSKIKRVPALFFSTLVRPGRFSGRVGVLCLMGLVACGGNKSNPASADVPAVDANSAQNMLRKMENPRPLPPPASEDAAKPNAPQAPPELMNDFEESPECKTLVEEEKTVRTQIDGHNRDIQGPASERAEAALEEYQNCQSDPVCINNIEAFQAKQGAYKAAQRAEDAAEKQTEQWETRLYEISQKKAAVCNSEGP